MEIKRCPFCGEGEHFETGHNGDEHYLCCASCTTTGPHAPTIELAAHKWNLRCVDDESMAELEESVNMCVAETEQTRKAVERIGPALEEFFVRMDNNPQPQG